MARGDSLAEHLQRSGRHPVIVFGGVASGKTMMLMSLIHALNRSASVNVDLGDPILPGDHPQAVQAHQLARSYFESHSRSMARGDLLPTTQVDAPLFIPIDIERRGGGPPVRLALLEGRGEWYMPIRESTGTMFQEFRPALVDVIELYSERLSVIWLAPYCIGPPDLTQDQDIEESDFALVGALAQYRRRRRSMSQDSHLFLLAKWDCFNSPQADEHFGVVARDTVVSILAERFRNAWPRYQGLPLQRGHRFFMQYSSGHIVADRCRDPPPRHRDAFARYPRSVLNWLYGNATEREVHGSRLRTVLFLDVLRQPPSPAPFLKRLTRFSTDAGFYLGVAWGVAGTALFFLAIILLGAWG